MILDIDLCSARVHETWTLATNELVTGGLNPTGSHMTRKAQEKAEMAEQRITQTKGAFDAGVPSGSRINPTPGDVVLDLRRLPLFSHTANHSFEHLSCHHIARRPDGLFFHPCARQDISTD
jgi:hypothetical protein